MTKIKEIRIKKNLSQSELARLSGMDRSNLNKIENGKKQPTLQTLNKIAGALKVSVKSLL